MSETYLPIKESLGYQNVKTALWNVFEINLDTISIREGKEYENFGFSLYYNGYEVTMILSGTGKHRQFEFGEGGELGIMIPNPRNTLFGASFLDELISDEEIRERIENIFGKDEKSVEYAMQVLKDFLDSDEAKVFLKNE